MFNIRCPACSYFCGQIVMIFLILIFPLTSHPQTIPFSLPLEKVKITSPFGMRIHPIKKIAFHHNGVDLAARDSPIFNILSAKVTKTGESPSLGKFLIMETGDIQITYGHLSRLLVQKDECLPPGHLVGISGKTGLATGEHLHLSVKFRGQFIDPILFLKKLNDFNFNPLMQQKDE